MIDMQIEKLSKAFGSRVLFSDMSFGLEQGDKVALVATNGSGKTTLLNIIAGREDYQSGQITFRRDIRVGYLEQNPSFDGALTVLQACFTSGGKRTEAIEAYERAVQSGDGLEDAMTQMERLGAWEWEQQAKEILFKLNITDFNQPISELSGGQLKRVALANALIVEPDILILDEPTNHLDLPMIEWLEGYLSRSRLTLLMVTHDRYFLDRVCNRIIEIDQMSMFSYKGNYGYYLEKREQRILQGNAEAQRNANLYKRELEWIRRTPSARTGKAKYRIDAFDELSTQRRTAQTSKQVQLTAGSARLGRKIFEMVGLSKRYDSKVILDNFNYLFSRGEKVGIVGDNGVGKSTFIKMLTGKVSPDSGTIDIGETVKFGYYSQDGLEFNPEDKVIDIVTKISEDITLGNGSRLSASQFLQHFLFNPKSQHDFVEKLSGGERRRLYLCTILISNPNFLILDEPTNDLDIQTLNVLEEYLLGFDGCVIVISHDRYFMDRVVDHLFVMEGDGKIKDFPGNYTDFRLYKAESQSTTNSEAKSKTVVQKPKVQASETSKKLSFKERKEFDDIERELPELEISKSALEERLSNPNLTSDELIAISTELGTLIELIDERMMRWLELSERS